MTEISSLFHDRPEDETPKIVSYKRGHFEENATISIAWPELGYSTTRPLIISVREAR